MHNLVLAKQRYFAQSHPLIPPKLSHVAPPTVTILLVQGGGRGGGCSNMSYTSLASMGLGMPRRMMNVGKDDVVTIHVVHPWQLWDWEHQEGCMGTKDS